MSAWLLKRVVLIGAGECARAWLDVLAERPELELTAIVDPEVQRAARLAQVPSFATVHELLAKRPHPDVAVLCSPPATHRELAEPLLRVGVDLLIEPPLATTPDDADAIAELAERLGRSAAAVARFRHSPAVEAARAALAEGAIGRLCGVEVALAAKRDLRADWRGDPALSGGGVWMESGADALDLLETLAGPARRIRMLESKSRQRGDVEDEARIETDHGVGLVGSARVSWNEALHETQNAPLVRCIGDRGELVIGAARSYLRDERGNERALAPTWDPHAAQLAALAAFLRARTLRESPIDPGAQTLAWLHAAYRSLRAARWEAA